MNNKNGDFKKTLRELALVFLKLGSIAFGGPAANIAMMEHEFVRKRHWLTQREFLDLLGATNMIPGPNSTEMAIHIGRSRAGILGLIVAGVCFVLPAMALVWFFAWLYVEYGSLPELMGIFYLIKPVIIAIIVQALLRLSKAALTKIEFGFLFIIALGASFLGGNELVVLFGTGLLCAFWHRMKTGTLGVMNFFPYPLVGLSFFGTGISERLLDMFLVFLKIGSVLFGSGYVLLAFFQAEFVELRHWLTQAQLVDAIAVGQFTPGPIFTSATFVGYLIGGPAGAALATLGIFLPAFVFVALSAPLIPVLRKSPTVGFFLDGVNMASLALMAVVAWQLASVCLLDWITVVVAFASLVILFITRINPAWLILAAAASGWGWERYFN